MVVVVNDEKHVSGQIADHKLLLTFKEAMVYLRVSRSTLYRLMWSNQLTGHKVGGTWRFFRQDLQAYVGQPESQGGTASW